MNNCLNCGKETNNSKFCSISCQNKSQNSEKIDKRLGLYKEFTVKCFRCGKEFIVTEREKLFPKKEKYFCSRGCANTRCHSDGTKGKIRTSLIQTNISNPKIKANVSVKTKKTIKNKKAKIQIKLICKNCEKEFIVSSSYKDQLFCSRGCSASFRMKNGLATILGKLSVKRQSEVRRSKNEIYFAELCKKHFSNVITNEPMFNGWDADVIIEDIKTAVLWNGKWHYEKIKYGTSVKQIQNRDKIKMKEIEGRGYKVYVIKDMGKHNKEFVEGEFNKFISLI